MIDTRITLHGLRLPIVAVAMFFAGPAHAEEANLDLLRWSEEAAAAGSMAVRGASGWLFLDREMRHLAAGRFWGEDAAGASAATNPAFADPLPAILDFYEQLAEMGVRLVIVPVPTKASVYPGQLPDPVTGEDVQRWIGPQQEFLDILRKAGVDVVDLQTAFDQKAGMDNGDVLFCQQDSHWSGKGIALAATRLLEFLPSGPQAEGEEAPYEAEWREQRIEGDLWKSLPESDRPEAERLRLHFVRDKASGESPVPNADSPVVLMGDSHSLIFHAGDDMHARGAGLPEQLALRMGFMPDVVAVRGSGATPARINLLRRSQRQPDYWENKEVVFWVFSVREFTQADGWRLVPVRAP